MNVRAFVILILIGLILVFLCAAIVSADEDKKYTVTNAPFSTKGNVTVREISQGNTVYFGDVINMWQVSGWEHRVYREGHEEDVIDVSNHPERILIDSAIFPEGTYFQWSKLEEKHGNLLAFFVRASNITAQVNQSFTNYTGVNTSTIERLHLPLETKQISDILVARGDPLIYTHPKITNTSSVWIFGVGMNNLYNISCQKGNFTVTAPQITGLAIGPYTVVIDMPGENTITESLYDGTREEILSPFIKKPVLDVAGVGGQVAAQKFVNWLKLNSDDEVIVLKMEIQRPHIEIMMMDMQYFSIDSLHVVGYTNLRNGSVISVSLDEDNRSSYVRKPPAFKSEALAGNIGEMRQWDVTVPFDEENATTGQHTIWARGNYSALAIVPYFVYAAPEGQQTPIPTVKYIGGNEWKPTPTPEVVTVERVVTHEVIKVVTREVTPKPEVVRKEQESVIGGYVVNIGAGLAICLLVVGVVGYARSVIQRKRDAEGRIRL